MTKYIVKQKAISALINEANTHSNPVKRAYTRAAALIEQITAEDVQTVRRGRWEKDEKRNSFEKFCSICKHEAYWDTDYGQQLFDYCPYCGADMRGGDAE